MSDDEVTTPAKATLKGRPRGGARFPKQPLSEAVDWSDKLVSKTHGGPQPPMLFWPEFLEATRQDQR